MEAEPRDRLTRVGRLLLDQERAEVLVEPRAREKGFWFGAGNICRGPKGALWLVGRYRNGGDARTGIEAGPRGAELAVLRSDDEGRSFEPAFSLLKEDLASDGEEVLSIEGACLYPHEDGVDLYVSSEKRRSYPPQVAAFQKPGTGVWSIDVLSAPIVEALKDAEPRPALRSEEPRWLHVKDPVVFDLDGQPAMLFCSHPFSWTSSNTGHAERLGRTPRWEVLDWSVLPRGPVWDVAVTRVTSRLALPRARVLGGAAVSLYFYDGAAAVRVREAGPARSSAGWPWESTRSSPSWYASPWTAPCSCHRTAPDAAATRRSSRRATTTSRPGSSRRPTSRSRWS